MSKHAIVHRSFFCSFSVVVLNVGSNKPNKTSHRKLTKRRETRIQVNIISAFIRAVLIMLFLVSRFLNEVSPVLNSKNSAKSVLIKKLAKMVSFGFVSLISPFLKRYFRHLIL